MAANDARSSVCSMLQEISRKLITRNLRSDEIDYIYFTIDRVEHILALCVQVFSVEAEIFSLLSEAKCLIGSELQATAQGFQSDKVFTGNRGRPRYNITRQQVEYFKHYSFNAVQMEEHHSDHSKHLPRAENLNYSKCLQRADFEHHWRNFPHFGFPS